MTRVPADEQRLREIERAHRHARSTRRTKTDSWLNGYEDDVGFLLALLRVREQEADELAAVPSVKAERDAALAEAAELREALREIAKGESYYVGDYMTIARAALEATDPAVLVADPAAEEGQP